MFQTLPWKSAGSDCLAGCALSVHTALSPAYRPFCVSGGTKLSNMGVFYRLNVNINATFIK